MANLDLARRAVACRGWRWMPGMRDQHGRRIAWTQTYPGGICDGDVRVRPDNGPVRHDSVPDFTDPATLGCLLALVREAWTATYPDAEITVTLAPDLTTVQVAHSRRESGCVTTMDGSVFPTRCLAESLVLALEAANVR